MTYGPGGLDFWTYRILVLRSRHDATSWGSSRRGSKAAQANDACGAFSDLLGRSWHKCTVDVDGEILVVWRWRQFCNLPISAGEWQGSVCVTCALRAIFGLWPSPVHISIYLPNIDSSVPASVRGGLTFGPGGLDFCQHFDRSKSLAPGALTFGPDGNTNTHN